MEAKFETESMVFFKIMFNYILYYYAFMSLYFQFLEKKKPQVIIKRRSLKIFCSRRKSIPHEVPLLILSLQDCHTNFESSNKPPKPCKLSSLLAAFELYPLLVVKCSILYYFKSDRKDILREEFNQIQKTRFTPDYQVWKMPSGLGSHMVPGTVYWTTSDTQVYVLHWYIDLAFDFNISWQDFWN